MTLFQMCTTIAHDEFQDAFPANSNRFRRELACAQLEAHATFGNAEIWVLEVVWNEDDTTDICAPRPIVRAHSLEQGVSLPHMSLSTHLDVNPPAPQQQGQLQQECGDLSMPLRDGDGEEGGSGSGGAEDRGTWCYQAEVQQIQLMTAFG